jgi:hypothetical protein
MMFIMRLSNLRKNYTMLSAGPPNLKPSGHKLVAIKPWIEKKVVGRPMTTCVK